MSEIMQRRRMFCYLGGFMFSLFGLTGFYYHWVLGVNAILLFSFFLILAITEKEETHK